MAEFSRNMAFIIGINNYTNGISSLHNAVNDAKKLIEILQQKHEYKVQECLDEVATLNNLNEFLEKILPEQVSENDRLLFYFAGHGIALNGDDGPEGYLIPQDAKLGDIQTYLPMTKLQESLNKLPCRHFLGILDCCFAGAFRWSSNRDLLTAPEVIHKERYDRFISDPAWQVITSAASDQKALDAFVLNSERGSDGVHSPFAAALIEALVGKADIYPPATNGKPSGDGVITATELYLYLRDTVEPATEGNRQWQTPGIWHLKKHDKGEYIFLSPGHPLNLPPAPPLDASKNPYRGLESYDEEHSGLFFGRTELVEKLHNFVKTHPLTVVLGASGSGKSSLVKAGLIPELRQDNTEQWCILPLIRPGETPMQALNNALKNAQLPEVVAQDIEQSLAMSIYTWAKNHPKINLLLFIDQSEEIITLCQNEDERKEFFQQILKAINVHRDRLRVVLSLRSDFEPQVRDAGLKFVDRTVNNLENTELKNRWYSGRFIIPAMTRGELRQAIEKPAEKRVMYFQPHELVEQLIDEVADMPGALPLLSFALSELYLKYLKRQWDAENTGITIDRALTQEDYQDLGGVIQSLTKRADEEYETLVKENPAYAQIIRHVMLRMIALGGGELARRRVPLSELEYPPEKNSFVTAVIERFTKARLLVKGEDADGNPYVEPAHDALVRGWQKLLMWKQEEQESLVLQQRLTPAATEWDSIKNKDKEQPKGILDRTVPIFDWLDQRLFFPIENKLSKIPAQFIRLLQRPQNQQERSREKPVQFLWNANPYLNVLDKELNSDDNWLNQVEAEFVQQSVLRKRRNISWVSRIAISLILFLIGLTLWALSGQKQALIEQMSANKNSTETMLRTNQLTLDALISSLRAGKSLNNWLFSVGFLKPQLNEQLQSQVIETLRTASYAVREQNRWQLPQGWIARDIVIHEKKILVAATTDNNNICVLNIQSHENLLCHEFSDNQSLLASPMLKFSPDSKKLVISDSDSDPDKPTEIVLWNLESNQIQKLKGDFVPDSYSFSPDSRKLAFIKDKTVYLWDGKNRPELYPLKGLQGDVKGINFKPDGNLLVATAIEGQDSPTLVHVLDCSSGEEKKYTFPDLNYIINIIIGNNGQPLYITFLKSIKNLNLPAILLWNPKEEKLEDLGFNKNVSFSPNGEQLVITQSDGTIKLRNSDSSEEQLTIQGHQGIFSHLSFTPNGKYLLTASNDGTISLWNLEQKLIHPTAAIEVPGLIDGFNFSQDGQQLVTLKADTVHLLDLSSIQELSLPSLLQQQKYNKKSKFILSPNGNQSTQLAILEPIDDESLKIHVWDLSLGKEQVYHSTGSFKDKPEYGRFSPDSKQLAIFDGNSSYLLNLIKNEKKELRCQGDILALAWTTDEKLVTATLGQDSVDIWELCPDSSCSQKQLASQKFGDEFRRTFDNSDSNTSFNTDGSLVNISYQDHTILWDWRRNLLVKFDQDADGYNLISPDGRTLVSFNDHKIKLWQLGGLDELLERGCKRVRGYLATLDENNSDRHLCEGIKASQLP